MAIVVWSSRNIAAVTSGNKIICREEVPSTRRDELATQLRAITGWSKLGFSSNGELELGSDMARGGSPTARSLLTKGQSGRNVIILEDATNRQDVIFSKVVPARWKHHASDMPPAFVIEIDFADFDKLIGDQVALRAFNMGWAFLHEVDHVVNDSADATTVNEAGECEDHINAMRRECGLPVRTGYYFTYLPHTDESDFPTRFARLAFDQINAATKKPHRYWVMWDATVVGAATREVATAR